MAANPIYDVVVFGATSFVGQILSEYLVKQYGVDGELSWAIAGRSEAKLRTLRTTLGKDAASLSLILADAADEQDMRDLCEGARVIISTVGPYALYGEPLVKACAQSGTDYCDLCGEVQWIKRMAERYHATATASGARIVHCCGFDSIPSDMGVWYLQEQAMHTWGEPCEHIQMRVSAFKGGVSGGTVASMLNLAKEASTDAALRRGLNDPYFICPPDHGFTANQYEQKLANYDRDFKQWTAPFVMAAINTRVVHRSNALHDNAYGDNFRYDEAILTGAGITGPIKAASMAAGTGAVTLGAAVTPMRNLLERFVVPKPGEGPSPQQQLDGFFVLDFLGHRGNGDTLRLQVRGDRDPGYGSTAKMLGQAGVCLAKDISHEDQAGGVLTPASVFGVQLINRLQQHAGVSFEMQES
jgi:short subunit dehydrogenase-like uncharacterized protein